MWNTIIDLWQSVYGRANWEGYVDEKVDRFMAFNPVPGIDMDMIAPKIKMFVDRAEEMAYFAKIKKKDATEYRVMIMSLGMIQLFNTLASVGIEWPPIMLELIYLFSLLSFNFDFFHPECSAQAEYLLIWLFLTLMPYIMLLPLTIAYMACKVIMLGEAGNTMKSRLLWNCYMRIVCVILLIVLPMHFKQVLIPFDCVPPTAGEGHDNIRQAPEVECTFDRQDYYLMYHMALLFLTNIFVLYGFIIITITNAFYWQFGNHVRDVMPAYCAMVEVSVLDMKGYIFEIRDYLKSYMIAMQAYHLSPRLMKRRALVE